VGVAEHTERIDDQGDAPTGLVAHLLGGEERGRSVDVALVVVAQVAHGFFSLS